MLAGYGMVIEAVTAVVGKYHLWPLAHKTIYHNKLRIKHKIWHYYA